MYIFSFDYPPNDGGIARLSAQLALGLTKRGFRVRVLTQQASERVDLDEQVSTKRFTHRRPIRELAALLELAQKKPASALVSSIWYPDGLIATVARQSPHIILAHGAELLPPPQRWRRGIWKKLQRYVLESADLVITNSHYTADLVESAAPGASIQPLPLAVDHEFFSPQDTGDSRKTWDIPEDKLVISTVARLNRFKGHDLVLNALHSLPEEIRKNILYLVAGKGPDLESLKREAINLGIVDNVRWIGYVDDNDLPSLYSASNLFVLPTRELPDQQSVEGFGLVFLEAQACGVPVVGTNTGGIPDAIKHGEGGWLIEQDDLDALVKILTNLYADPDSFKVMGMKARERIQAECTWDHYVDQFLLTLNSHGIYLEQS